MTNRVFVTSFGCVSAFGVGVEALAEGLRSGRHGLRREKLGRDDWSEVSVGRVEMEDLSLDKAESLSTASYWRTLPRSARMAVQAAKEATYLGHFAEIDSTSVPIFWGSGGAIAEAMDQMYEDLFMAGTSRAHPSTARRISIHEPMAAVARALGNSGPARTISTACNSSLDAIGLGFEAVASGAGLVVVGGSDSAATFGNLCLWRGIGAVDDQPAQPFRRNRKGFVLADGAAALCLEDAESAKIRGSAPFAEILAHQGFCDLESQFGVNDLLIERSIRAALDIAGLRSEQLSLVVSHGLGTMQGDAAEATAIARIISSGDRPVPLSAFKGYIGHSMAASGALDIIAAIISARERQFYPALGSEVADPTLAIRLEPHRLTGFDIRYSLKLSYASGGLYSAMVLDHAPLLDLLDRE